ncbi:MAG: TolC family protein, partial [Deltaproteobacteria bacterium]|nr:TolC family protein [Deltaproteobacteria bacterium]
MRNFIITVAIVFCFAFTTTALAAQSNPQSIRALIALGLETNLGLKMDSIEVEMGAETMHIEAAAFDSTLFAATGYDHSSIPYESSFSSSSQMNSEKLSGQIGVGKRFQTGLTTSLSLDSEWVSDNDSSLSLDPRYRTALFLDLNQPLLRNLGSSVNTTRLQISRNQQRQIFLGYLLQAQTLTLQLEVVARRLAAKTEIVQLRQEALALAADLHSANKKRFKAGVIPVTEVQEAETALAARQLSLSL